MYDGLCLSTTGLIKDIKSAVTNWASQDGESVCRFSAIIDTILKEKSPACPLGRNKWGLDLGAYLDGISLVVINIVYKLISKKFA